MIDAWGMTGDIKQAYGWLAEQFGKRRLPLEVCTSQAGFYLGTRSENGEPFSRESHQYWARREEAERALKMRDWTQRPEP